MSCRKHRCLLCPQRECKAFRTPGFYVLLGKASSFHVGNKQAPIATVTLPNSPIPLDDVISTYSSNKSTLQYLRYSLQLCKETHCYTTTTEGILPAQPEHHYWTATMVQESCPATTFPILLGSCRPYSFLSVTLFLVKHKHLGYYMVQNISKKLNTASLVQQIICRYFHATSLCNKVLLHFLVTAQKTLLSSYLSSQTFPIRSNASVAEWYPPLPRKSWENKSAIQCFL